MSCLLMVSVSTNNEKQGYAGSMTSMLQMHLSNFLSSALTGSILLAAGRRGGWYGAAAAGGGWPELWLR